MKLYVEMTEQEYEEYKKLKQHDIKQEIKELDIYELLVLNGFRKTYDNVQRNLVTGEDVRDTAFEKGKKKIVLQDKDI